jgi:UDP-sugar diphosphatase
MLFNVKNFKIQEAKNIKFVKPVSIHYELNGKKRVWDAIISHASVAILLYDEDKKCFVLVKQFRPPVYMNNDKHLYTYELCAGIVDKELSLEQIAIEEVDEECGYQIKKENLEKITSFFTHVGISGSEQHLYFSRVNSSMKAHNGGGIETEDISVEYLPIDEAKAFIFDTSKAKTPGLMFAFYWFFDKEGL